VPSAGHDVFICHAFEDAEHANDSPAVTNELELAMNAGKVIVPVPVEDVMPSRDLAFYVRAVH
jgi:hypothetical protein